MSSEWPALLPYEEWSATCDTLHAHMALVAALDLRTHEAVVEHSDGRVQRIPLVPDRPVG